jgi:hypothetical protein
MIPSFDESGCLPPGIHPATLAEIEARFGRASEIRRVQMESVRWMVDLAGRAGVERIVLNGSFVTDIIEPNDVDCVLLIGVGFPRDQAAESELVNGLPFLDVALVDREDFDEFVGVTFASDRWGGAQGHDRGDSVTLNSEVELINTRYKLGRLEARYEVLRHETGGDEHVRELTMRSLKRLINQLKEEIARYQARQPARR